jgi:protein-disulfide isomerase/uncharacterized membrane protein
MPQLAAALALCAGLVMRDSLTGIIGTAFLGFACSGYLLQQKVEASTGGSLCNIDQVFNCDTVNRSEWSMAFGVPISLLGMGFYGGLIVAALQAPTGPKRNPTFFRITALISMVSAVYGLFLLGISKQIGAFCVVCITMYAVNFILVWAGWRGLREQSASLLSNLGAAITSAESLSLVATFLVGVIWGSNWYEGAAQPAGADLAEAARRSAASGADPAVDLSATLAQLYGRSGGPVQISGNEPLLGDPNAAYQITEFADFGCPHCADASVALKELVAASPDVAVRFKYFPLSGACNPMLADPADPGPDPSRCHAAYAAECANVQGKFWEMSTQLFNNQGQFGLEQLEGYAGSVGVDLPKWRACMEDPKTAASIERSAREGEAAGVHGTPALYIKGLLPETVEIRRGVPAVLALIEAHRDGLKLPAPSPER